LIVYSSEAKVDPVCEGNACNEEYTLYGNFGASFFGFDAHLGLEKVLEFNLFFLYLFFKVLQAYHVSRNSTRDKLVVARQYCSIPIQGRKWLITPIPKPCDLVIS
jgi:hypothetical protein